MKTLFTIIVPWVYKLDKEFVIQETLENKLLWILYWTVDIMDYIYSSLSNHHIVRKIFLQHQQFSEALYIKIHDLNLEYEINNSVEVL